MLLDKIRYTGCAFGEYSANNTTLYDTCSIILYLLYFQEEDIVRVTFLLLISITNYIFLMFSEDFSTLFYFYSTVFSPHLCIRS